MDYECELSVVLIARNEEEMIADCIESVIKACDYAKEKGVLGSYEVILSDSASTDRTVEIAKKYPVRIVQLRSSWKLSAPAGRYIGSLYANGKYVFFTDGDCIVYENFIARALPYLSDEKVAGVVGYEREHVAEGNFFYESIKAEAEKNEPKSVERVDWIGKGIFKRDILMKAGSYNPWLRGCEERELCFRIRKLGYGFLSLPFPGNLHHWAKKSGNLKYWQVVRTTIGWSLGDGNYWKMNGKAVWPDIRKRYFGTRMLILNNIPMMVVILLGAVNLLALLSRETFLPYAAAVDTGFVIGIFALKLHSRKSLVKTVYRYFEVIPYTVIRTGCLLIGRLGKSRNIAEYPTDAVELVKNA